MNMNLRRWVGALTIGAAAAAACAGGEAWAQEVRDFYNVAAPDGADPWVLRHDDGWYYATYTTGRSVVLRRSRTITGLDGGEARVAWEPPPGTPFSREIWAPEVHHLRGRWYIYVAADGGENADHRMYALENASPDPFEGAFVLKGKVADPASDRWAIDGTVMELGDRLYFVWSGWEGDVDVDQRLYIAPMSDPTTIAGPRVELSRPTLDWEKAAGPPAVNEGPQVLTRGGRTFLVYSAAGSWSSSYCLGMLSLEPGADPLEPSSWTKAGAPVFAGARGVVAPGHASFTKSPDGAQDWIVYHAAKSPGSGWSRSVRAQPFRWGEDGAPAFDAPWPANAPIAIPSGEPGRLRLEAESSELGGDARGEPDPGCSGGSKVVGLERPGSRAAFVVPAGEAGTYVAAIRYRSVDGPKARAEHLLLVDGRPAGTIAYPDSGAPQWSSALARLPLRAGSNRVELAPGLGRVEVDCLDLINAPER